MTNEEVLTRTVITKKLLIAIRNRPTFGNAMWDESLTILTLIWHIKIQRRRGN